MLSTRPAVRASIASTFRASGAPRAGRNATVRFQSTAQSASHNPMYVGLAAGAAGGVVAYGLWHLSPAGAVSRKINKAAYEAQSTYSTAVKKLQDKTPYPDEALDMLKEYAYTYVAWIPGGRGVVDATFKDVDKLRESHGKELDELVRESYGQVQNLSKEGLSMSTVRKAADIFNDFAQKLAGLAGGSFMEIMDNHPQIKSKIGQPVQQLKQMGDSLGPEAKEQVDKTWDQLKEIFQGGFSAGAIYKAQQLVSEKSELLRNMGDKVWEKGMEQAKPMLDKNPKVKELIEKNKDALKQGNATELFQKASEFLKSGDTSSIEKYISQAVDKTKDSASGFNLGGLEQYVKLIPGGEQIMPKIGQIKQVAENHKEEGEKLLKETANEIQKLLEQQANKAQKLLDNAKRESSK